MNPSGRYGGAYPASDITQGHASCSAGAPYDARSAGRDGNRHEIIFVDDIVSFRSLAASSMGS
jgi:hypothetical protein